MFVNTHDRPSAPRRGAVVPLVAICLIALIGFVAIAADGGLLLTERRHAQTVADAAALAAAADLYAHYSTNQGLDPNGTAAASAKSVASANGYTNNGTTSSVTVNIPPTSGPNSGTKGYAEVIVKHYQSRDFSAIYGSGNLTVSARGVARCKPQTHPGPGMIVLDATAQKAFNFTAAGNLTIPNGTLEINSSNSDAADVSGGGNVYTQEVDITGNANRTTQFITSPIAGQVFTGHATTSDPLSSLAIPAIPSQTYTPSNNINSDTTLNPGYYPSGISISNGTVTLNPGLYYVKGGGFAVSGGTVTGTGVMIYADPSTTGVNISGGYTTLSAPTSGTYQGIVVFQRRNATGTDLRFSQAHAVTLTGTVYAAASQFYTSNSGTLTITSQVICDTAKITGGADVVVNGGAGTTSNGGVNLVE